MDLDAIYVIWLREMKRFFRDRSSLLIGVVRPVSWLVFLGAGLSPYVQGHGPDYSQFLLPGMAAMAILFTAIQSAIGIIWDREFGFLKEMLVAPISRTSIVLGKAAGGVTLAVTEGVIVILLAPLLHMRILPLALLEAVGVMVLIAFSMSALGITIAARMKSFEGFGAIMNFIIMPLFLLSGALFPIERLPPWLKVLVHLNPLSYGVDLLRGALLRIYQVPPLLSLMCITGFTFLMLAVAVWQFNTQEI
jgi:ABC-2 type transport system permease protein